jgi:hypothetical protein
MNRNYGGGSGGGSGCAGAGAGGDGGGGFQLPQMNTQNVVLVVACLYVPLSSQHHKTASHCTGTV